MDAPVLGRPALLEGATLEVTARDKDAADVLRRHLPPGARVHVTHLSNSPPAETVAQAVALARAGFEPVPHVAARSVESAEALEDYLSRLAGEAGASRVLLIAGDLAAPRGPFGSALDVLQSGALQRAGLKGVGFAGHPEGHPLVGQAEMRAALRAKIEYAIAHELQAEIVTQFCFEAAPILAYVEQLRADGMAAPVRIGLAAPTNPALMLKFAVRCGVGPSLRALQSQNARLAKLAGVAGPEAIIADLARGLDAIPSANVAGLHFFVFGGVKSAATWLKAQRVSPPK